jgi:hypothetical protein
MIGEDLLKEIKEFLSWDWASEFCIETIEDGNDLILIVNRPNEAEKHRFKLRIEKLDD